jgi:DNA-binding MarR family transcriptional regulator
MTDARQEVHPVSDDERERAAAVAAAWARELPGVPVRSIPVVWAVKTVAATLRRAREGALRDIGIDAATLDLLSTLRRAGDPYVLTTRQLAERCLVSAGAISQRLARAERDGLVERRSAEGRRVEVALTAAGHALAERGARHVLATDEALTSGLTDAEVETLRALHTRWAETAARA